MALVIKDILQVFSWSFSVLVSTVLLVMPVYCKASSSVISSTNSITQAQRRAFLVDSLRNAREQHIPVASNAKPVHGKAPPPGVKPARGSQSPRFDPTPLPAAQYNPPKEIAPHCIPCSGLSGAALVPDSSDKTAKAATVGGQKKTEGGGSKRDSSRAP